MKKTLSILISLTLLFSSCNTKNKKANDSYSKKYVTSFNITSKNPALTSQKGTDVSLEQMTTKNLISGEKIIFKNVEFTLDNQIENALNFSSKNGQLICNVPTKLSVMSMPPDGNGEIIYSKGDHFELSGISLIKINDINFVISNIKFNE